MKIQPLQMLHEFRSVITHHDQATSLSPGTVYQALTLIIDRLEAREKEIATVRELLETMANTGRECNNGTDTDYDAFIRSLAARLGGAT